MQCPICKKPVPEPGESQPRGDYPFCGPRCKLIDLGRWLSDRYQIPCHEDEADAAPDPDLATGDQP
jgi:endogenous inhibitor of DNA gyrase (YacG/DUF329 family)